MTCKHCDRTILKSEPMKICPMHGRPCGVCMPCYEQMTATIPEEPRQDERGIWHGLDLHEPPPVSERRRLACGPFGSIGYEGEAPLLLRASSPHFMDQRLEEAMTLALDLVKLWNSSVDSRNEGAVRMNGRSLTIILETRPPEAGEEGRVKMTYTEQEIREHSLHYQPHTTCPICSPFIDRRREKAMAKASISKTSEMELHKLVERLDILTNLMNQPSEPFERGIRQAEIREVYISMSVILNRKG